MLDRRRGRGLTVTLSWAQSLNGAIAKSGKRTAISSRESHTMTHRLRAVHGGILVGIGTVLSDDPSLSVRLVEGRQPQTIVLDSELRTPPDSAIVSRRDVKPWIFHAGDPGERGRRLTDAGARLFAVPRGHPGLDLVSVTSALSSAGLESLFVEGGSRVLSSFLGAGLCHQVVVTVAPTLMAGNPVLPPAEEIDVRIRDVIYEWFGPDLVLSGRIES